MQLLGYMVSDDQASQGGRERQRSRKKEEIELEDFIKKSLLGELLLLIILHDGEQLLNRFGVWNIMHPAFNDFDCFDQLMINK